MEFPLQSACVYASRCSGSLHFRILIPSFGVHKRYLPSRRNLRRSASPGDASVLLTSWTAKSDVWAVLQEMSENAHATAVSTSVSFTQSRVVLVALLARLDYRCRHRFTLVVAETQDAQNVLDANLTWCNANRVRIHPRSRCTEVTVL